MASEDKTPTRENPIPPLIEPVTKASKDQKPPINCNPKDPASPFFLNLNDGPGTLLTNHPLTPENYHSWACTVCCSLRIKKKLVFIDGTLLEPSSTNDSLEPWLECNDMVVTWLQNALSLEIKNSVVYVETANEL
ncbi:hypothetical protein Patl1_33985 [Pistacia atlantica]|uniref:Uncharacterized protein n=1 Tax=Pistacia atlantica TaxID=434234 RepID=A0ACC0ZRS1_9ROSI|nr:hypothetical protein Patl1_33985 [Pistacia atlantica]